MGERNDGRQTQNGIYDWFPSSNMLHPRLSGMSREIQYPMVSVRIDADTTTADDKDSANMRSMLFHGRPL